MKTKQPTKIHLLLVMFALLTGLSSCLDELFVEGNGDLQTQNRQISGFDAIASSGDFQVSVMPGSEFSVEVKAESNLLPYIETQLSGKTLKIGTVGVHSLRRHQPIWILITLPELNGLNLSGSGRIQTGSFNSDLFQIGISGSGEVDAHVVANKVKASVSGSGSVLLSGEAIESDFRISGSGKINAWELAQDHCLTSVSGSGDIYVNVSQTLYAGISGSGRVYYMGHPNVQSHISGSGKIVDKN